MVDTDLETLSREQLIAEAMKLRNGIRKHRDSSGHELCWHHPALWGLLPEKNGSDPGGAGMAAIHPGVRALPAVPRRTGTECIAYIRALSEMTTGTPAGGSS